MPPSAPTIQYPPPPGVGAMPTTEALALGRAFWPSGASPNGTTELAGGELATREEPAEAPATAGDTQTMVMAVSTATEATARNGVAHRPPRPANGAMVDHSSQRTSRELALLAAGTTTDLTAGPR